jgi:hypothetical protein
MPNTTSAPAHDLIDSIDRIEALAGKISAFANLYRIASLHDDSKEQADALIDTFQEYAQEIGEHCATIGQTFSQATATPKSIPTLPLEGIHLATLEGVLSQHLGRPTDHDLHTIGLAVMQWLDWCQQYNKSMATPASYRNDTPAANNGNGGVL